MKAPAFLSRWLQRNGNGTVAAISKAEERVVINGMEPEQKARLTIARPLSSIPEDQVIGVASCRHCGAELELVCPNGHGGADDVLADLTAPKKRAAAPAPKEEESTTLQFSVVGCDSPRVPWKGRGRKPTRCAAHLTKHPEQKRSA